MSLSCPLASYVPQEVHIFILTYLRATDLSCLQRTCRTFHDRSLIRAVIHHTANFVYPPELTQGFDTPIVGGEVSTTDVLTYESLRNMEMLVVARVLSRPDPPLRAFGGSSEDGGGFYVSKAWCRAALRWLEVQQEERREREVQLAADRAAAQKTAMSVGSINGKHRKGGKQNSGGKNKHGSGKKLSKKQERQRNRKLSDALPPWPNVNDDIVCEHGDLRRSSGEGSKTVRARRRVLDRQAWKVLKKLYPESVQLSSIQGECLQCAMEAETLKKNEHDRLLRESEERKRPLGCALVRGIYTRSRGVPSDCLVSANSGGGHLSSTLKGPMDEILMKKRATIAHHSYIPLVPGVYHALPRSWCHRWRKYIKTGEGGRPCAPDASACLCDAHKLPLVPPHLDAFLYGEIPTLLAAIDGNGLGRMESYYATKSNSPMATVAASIPPVQTRAPVGLNPTTHGPGVNATMANLLAAGLSESELHVQRLAMLSLERQNFEHNNVYQLHDLRQQQVGSTSSSERASVNEQLDRENKVVVEIVTDEEFTALERWWPEIHSSYALKFAITERFGMDSNSRAYDIVWTTPPCRDCDATGRCADLVMRNRYRNWAHKKR